MKIKMSVNVGMGEGREDKVSPSYFGLTDEEWKNMSDDDKWKIVESWADNYVEIGFYEDEDDE